MKKFVLLFLASFLLYGCPPECDDMLSATGPPIILIELIDTDSDENIFTKELFTHEDIQIIDDDGNNIELRFISENNYNIIELIPYRYDDENTIFLNLRDEINIELVFDISEFVGECSSSFFIEDLEVENYPFKIDNQSGIVKIKV